MQLDKISEGATNASTMRKQTRYVEDSTALKALQALRDIAWQQAIKYRWDPAIGRAHEEYLRLLNGMLKECEA